MHLSRTSDFLLNHGDTFYGTVKTSNASYPFLQLASYVVSRVLVSPTFSFRLKVCWSFPTPSIAFLLIPLGMNEIEKVNRDASMRTALHTKSQLSCIIDLMRSFFNCCI